MNFTSGGVEEETLDLERQKIIREREWEEARKREAKLPENLKAENYDPRSLYERLQEQKDKKQSEIDEKLKFKNQIQYLDDDDVAFLEDKAREEEEKEASRWQEELDAVKAFRQQQLSKEEAKAEQFNVAGGKDASAAQKPKAPSLPKKKDRSNIIGSLVKPKSNVQVDAAAAETKRTSADSPASADQGEEASKRPRLEAGTDTNTDTDYDNKSVGTSILAMYGSDTDDADSD